MKIKIQSVDGIGLSDQLQIIQDYITTNNNGKPYAYGFEPLQTKKGIGTKIDSCNRRYHVSCQKANTMWVFSIWWGV